MVDNKTVTSSTPAFRLRWDVFLSFRGEDTRDGFTDRLYNELERQGVRVFRDNDGLTQGDEIAQSLLDAIEDSAAAIAIISPRYANSRWCLEELAKICECERLILPVFYLVDPSNVRRQKGPFEEDFRSLEIRFGEHKVGRWRSAMEKAGGISGWVFQNRRVEEWEDALQKLKQIRPHHLQDVLKISFDGLDDEEKCIFLDIACLFVNLEMKRDDVAENLMVMNLHGCYNLTAIPDLSKHHALEKLILERCISLTTIHKSLGDMTTLRHLNMRGCYNIVDFPNDVSGLKHLEILILSGCSKLKELPQDMRGMNSLKELLIDGTAIEKLPDTIFLLTKLEKLSLDRCQSLKRLPQCIGKLGSLRDFSLNGSALEDMPDSIGSLGNLEQLSLMWCKSLTVLPDSVGNIKSLTKFWLNSSSVKELPTSIGSLAYLKDLSLGNCCDISRLPVSIGGLASVVDLQLDGTSIIDLPDQVDGLKSLEKLEMRNCRSLRSLPESIGCVLTLSALIIVNAAITELPESIGMLENLIMLRLNKCTKLCRLPASIGNLKSLHHLLMEETAVTELPENFGMLSRLMILKMAKKPDHEVSQNAENTELPSSFSNLSLLEEFDARAWKIAGKIPDDFEKLSSLSKRTFILEKLVLSHCKYLKVLPPLPSSLVELNAANCTALESISDISNLENLQNLNLANCEKLTVYVCLEAKSQIGLLETEVSYSKPKNRVIKAVIVGIVVSIDHSIRDDLRDQSPVVAGILITILRLNKPIFNTAPLLEGVPKTDEDHFYLCRYENYNPLVLFLKDGDKIRVATQNPSPVKGVHLKKCGIHLVFENDDDYVGDENFLREDQQSVSQKLTTFMGSSEEDKQTLDPISKVEREKPERKQRDGNSFVLLFIVLPLSFLLLSWLVFMFYIYS
ncbi:hypothetical protein HYC85_015533 [Camellia sinensis]|uniref:TIR domain-containing protein n=1 Tax=Camellia sinensis TaxID=4442 RepID=A0A7J7GYF7_CAMSI|nr:hypothetical protein HYC85_015533 [Camellia sinensis]